MKFIADTRAIDQQAIALGIAGLVLMEEAGRQLAAWVSDWAAACEGSPHIVIVAGPGNNGGDGFTCARHLFSSGFRQITVIDTGHPERRQGDRKIQFEALSALPILVLSMSTPEVLLLKELQQADLIVDSLLGVGLARPLGGKEAWLVEAINQTQAYKLAVDLPSGVDAETGQVLGVAVNADETLTFSAPKPGLYLYPGKKQAGKVSVLEIGIPSVLLEEAESRFFLITPQKAWASLPKRWPDAHKYEFGNVLVVAGSRNMPGAALLTAEAALTAGAGLVTLAAPTSVFGQLSLPPEVIRLPLSESTEGTLSLVSLSDLEPRLSRYDVVALGPGIGHTAETVSFIEHLFPLLQASGKTVVLDADGLNCLALLKDGPLPLGAQFILTPHLGECARLLQQDVQTLRQSLLQTTQHLVQAYGATVVLKSATSLVGSLQGQTWLSPLGNSGMATAGSGDVLTGIIAGIAAQKASPFEAALCGTYLHGLAGEIGADCFTEYSLRASHISQALPEAFHQLLTQERHNP